MAIDLYKNRCSVYEGGEPYIFVSYSHQDIERVVTLIRKLQSLGFRVWHDSGVPAGAEWPEEIAIRLKNSGCVLSLMSPNSVCSTHFREEFTYAKHLKKPILIAYLEDCDLTPGIEMRVVSHQCIKCEHCEDDDDLVAEIARAAILKKCQGKIEGKAADPEAGPSDAGKLPDTQNGSMEEKARQGDPRAQTDLGYAYLHGNGVKRDPAQAFKWYKLAAEQGYAVAQTNLAILYHDGNGVDKDLKLAAYWYEKAAEQNEVSALNNLGWSYETGEGVEPDLEKAVSLYRRSAEGNCSMGMYNMGRVYESGIGVKQDWAEAVSWYRRAAVRRQSWSQRKLAECYRKGLGVPIDEAEADRWQKLYDENPNK